MTYLRFGDQDVSSFHETLVKVSKSVAEAKVEGASIAPPDTRDRLEKDEHIEGPVARIVFAWQQLEGIVRIALEDRGIATSTLGPVALLQSAFESGVLTEAQLRSLRGLNVMRNLAFHSPCQKVDAGKAEEFIILADAMKTILKISHKAS